MRIRETISTPVFLSTYVNSQFPDKLFRPVNGGQIEDVERIEFKSAQVLGHGDEGSAVLNVDVGCLFGEDGLARARAGEAAAAPRGRPAPRRVICMLSRPRADSRARGSLAHSLALGFCHRSAGAAPESLRAGESPSWRRREGRFPIREGACGLRKWCILLVLKFDWSSD